MARRNPLGSIIERRIKRGGKTVTVYEARKRVRGRDGKYRDKTKRCDTYAEAMVALHNISHRPSSEGSPKTFQDLTRYYRENYCQKAVISHGRKVSGYRQRIKPILKYLDDFDKFFGTLLLSDLTYDHIAGYGKFVATTPIRGGRLPKPATVNRKLAYLRRILNIAKRQRWIPSNPFHDGEPLIKVSEETARNRILTFEEEERLLDAIDLHYLRLIVILAIDTGMRQKEIFALLRSDLDFTHRRISVRAENTKALKERIIPMSARVYDELKEYLYRHFVPKNGEVLLGLRSVKKSFASALRRAKIEDFRFHDLRHTATTWMDQAGISEAAKKNMIGHSSEAVHQRYHNVSSDILDDAREKMDRFRRKRRA